jgi:rod shape-determining protein MreD
MKNIYEAAAAVLASIFLFSILVLIHPSLVLVINPFALAVIYLAIVKGEVFGAAAGTACGLVQDAFSIGVFGQAGLTKTLMGFLAGSISRKINIAPFSRRFLFAFLLSAGELALWTSLNRLLSAGRASFGSEWILLQPPAVALAVALAFHIPGWFKARKKS